MGIYKRLIHQWETRLAARDRNRVVRPFEWGLEWLQENVAPGRNGQREPDPARCLLEHNEAARAASDDYFSFRRPRDFRVKEGCLVFTSPLRTPHERNNTVYARFLPARRRGRAVVLLPQWNADGESHVGLARLLSWMGITALRLSLPYHDRRMPAGLQRAEYHVSSNVGRTIHACRQAVVDARACLEWLEEQGYGELGILGSSLGSCIALLVAAHEPRIRAAVFNHIAPRFADVVWTGISTVHVRQGLEQQVSLAELRRYWSVISPATYLDRLMGRALPSLLVWATHDLSFLPKYSRQALAHYRRRGLPHRSVAIPCGHYTMGRSPFRYLDGFTMSWFLHRNLKARGA